MYQVEAFYSTLYQLNVQSRQCRGTFNSINLGTPLTDIVSVCIS